MKKNLRLSALVSALILGTIALNAAGVAKYQGKDLVTQKDVDAKIQELKLGAMPREQVFMQVLVQLAEERLMAKSIKESKIESDPEFKRVAKLNAEEFKRAYYLQKEAQKRVTQSMRQAVYDQIKASVKGKKEINPRIIVLTDEKIVSDVYARLQKGEKFEVLAKAHSIDPSKENGGLIGKFLPEEAFAPEVVAELSNINEGVVSKPIKTSSPSGTVHIIFLIEKGNRREYQLPAIDAPEMATQIEQMITRQMISAVQADFARQLEVYDLKGNKIPLVPEQEAQTGIPLIGGGIKK